MDKFKLIGITAIPLILSGIIRNTEVLLYYLVLDSWLILRISDISIFHPVLTLNRIITYVSFFIILFQRVRSGSLFPKAMFSLLTYIITIFIFYLFYSNHRWTNSFDLTILNNLIFYYLVLFITEKNVYRSFQVISIVACLPVLLLSGSSIINAILNMDIGQRSFAGNRIHSAFYVCLGLCFLFGYRRMIVDKTILKIFINIVILLGIISVAISLGRMVTFILTVLIIFFLIKGYLKLKTVAIFSFLSILVITLYSKAFTLYLSKLIRFPDKKIEITAIKKFNEDKLGAFTSGRSRIYKKGWKLFKQHPLIGMGYDWWAGNPYNRTHSSFHSRWLQLLVECGIIGFIFYALIFIICILYLRKIRSINTDVFTKILADSLTACLFAFFFIGITDNHGYTDRLFYLISGLIANLRFSLAKISDKK